MSKSYGLIGAVLIMLAPTVFAQGNGQIFDNGFDVLPKLSLSAPSDGPLELGDSLDVLWSTQNAQSGTAGPCTRFGQNSTWAPGNLPVEGQAPFGSLRISLTATAPGDTVVIGMTCAGNKGTSVTRSVEYVVVAPPSCPSVNPHGLTVIPGFWPGLFRSPSGISPGNAQPQSVGSCAALRFNSRTANTQNWRFGQLELLTAIGFIGNMSVSLSRCPCDFGALNTPTATCKTPNPSPKQLLRWGVSVPAAQGLCVLRANTDYFVNITFGSQTQAGLGTCISGSCSAIGQNVCAGPSCGPVP